MTGQTLLNMMGVLDQTLSIAAGGVDVTNALLALNMAQDAFESLAAEHRNFLGGQTANVTTTLNTETTAFPSGFIRIDKCQKLGTDGLPEWDLTPIPDVGGHAPSNFWPFNLVSSSTGAPRGFWTDGTNLYWDPAKPDGTYTIRVYGFKRATDIAAGTPFTYDDGVASPLAALAVRILRTGTDDPPDTDLVRDLFDPIIKALKKFNVGAGKRLTYSRVHDC